MSSRLTIGAVARAAGVDVETLRFYEREGLLPKPPRRPSGYRQYPPDALRRLQFIRAAKRVGFSLAEIRELLSLRVGRGRSCADVRHRALAKVAEMDTRIDELRRMRGALERLAATCVADDVPGDCALLDALEAGGVQDGAH